MALTYETSNWTGQDRDDMQTNDSIEWAKKSYTYEWYGETRTVEYKVNKEEFTVGGAFDAVACEAHLDKQMEWWQKHVDINRYYFDPVSLEPVSL